MQHALFDSKIRNHINHVSYYFNGERNLQNVELNSLWFVDLRMGLKGSGGYLF